MFEKYRSRKWILTLLVLVIATGTALAGKLSGELAQVLTGLVISYNAFQGFVDWKKAGND